MKKVKKYFLYKISNIINDKSYIGISTDLKKRWSGHLYSSKKSKLQLYVDMRKFGSDKFQIEEIHSFLSTSNIEANKIEAEYIKEHNSLFPVGYNKNNRRTMRVFKVTTGSLSIKEKIARNLDGRKQKWVIEKMNELGNSLTDVTFSRKKSGDFEFSEKELKDLSIILGVDITV